MLARALYLEEIPAYIHNDESATAVYITPPFFSDPRDPIMWGQNNYGGHANFGAWVASLFIRAFGGKTLWAIRMGSVVCGVLSIIFTALFVRSWLGLRAMVFFVMAVVPFHLHVHFSRTGFIYMQAALFIGLVAYLFGRLVRRPTIGSGVLLGIATGFSLMVYSATYVLVGALAIGVLAALASKSTRTYLKNGWIVKSLAISGAIVVGALLVLGQLLYHAYTDGFTSRFSQQSIFRDEVRKEFSARVGHEASSLEMFRSYLWDTVCFFWDGDASGQYGLAGAPFEVVSGIIVLAGLAILLYRCCRMDPFALFIATLGLGTVLGSSCMIERNFAPHFIAFGLILPMLAALTLDNVFRFKYLNSPVFTAITALALFVPWAGWNYTRYSAFDEQKRHLDTFVLHLPIQREHVKTIVNYTPFITDLSESFYMLRYPQAKGLKLGESPPADITKHLSDLMANHECPCVAVLPDDQYGRTLEFLTSKRANFKEFFFDRVGAKMVYVE